MLSNIEENGTFLVWGNANCKKNVALGNKLSFTYNCSVFHVHLEMHLVPNDFEQLSAKNEVYYLEIGKIYS